MAYPNVANLDDRTHNVGVVRDAFKFAVGAAGAVGTISQGSGAFISGVAHTAAGRYTVTFAKPYPASLILCQPSLSCTDPDADLVTCRYKTNSYSPTAGTFEICTADVDGLDGNALAAVLMSAVDPANPSEVMVDLAFLDV